MSEKLTWELILVDPPEPTPEAEAEDEAYWKRVESRRRHQCLVCSRFVKSSTWRIRQAPNWDLPDYAVYECSKCGPMSEPL